MSVILLDIDNFKTINDKYGHLEGDCIIKSLVILLSLQVRDSDYFIRYGGDEFLICLTNTTLNQANMAATKYSSSLRSKIVTLSCKYTLIKDVSISMGLAQLTGIDTFSSLLDRADQNLLRAKALGKNRICF